MKKASGETLWNTSVLPRHKTFFKKNNQNDLTTELKQITLPENNKTSETTMDYKQIENLLILSFIIITWLFLPVFHRLLIHITS